MKTNSSAIKERAYMAFVLPVIGIFFINLEFIHGYQYAGDLSEMFCSLCNEEVYHYTTHNKYLAITGITHIEHIACYVV